MTTQPPLEHAVLVVDDDPGICRSLSRILRQDGYRVDVASSAAEAIDRDHWSEYLAILLDRHLPDSAANDLLPKIIARAPSASVLVITGYADLEDGLAAIRAGAADYLLKPVNPEELRVRLRRLADLQRAQVAVRRRDEQVQFMIDHLPAGAAYVDNVTGALRVNHTIERITGYSAETLADRDAWFDCVFGSRAEVEKAEYEQDRLAGFQASRIVQIVTASGDDIQAEFSAYRYDDHEVWLIHDVTERLRIQEELRQQRDFSDQLLENAQVIVLVLDLQGRIVRFNQFTQEVTGYPLGEVLGKNWFETFLPAEEATGIRAVFQRVVDGEAVRGMVNSIRTREGRHRQIAWWAKALRNADECVTGVLSIGHDVTALKDVQARLLQSERLAAIGQMIAGLAHESRNALQRARACLDMLSLDLDGQSRQLELTQRVQLALNELQRLYEEVRGYAAPIKLSLGEADIADVWRTAWQHIGQSPQTHQVTLRETNAETDTVCQVDRYRLEQVFRNVLENAVAVTPEHGTISLACEACRLNRRPAISITITDQGPGLTPAQVDSLFEPFFTTKQKGTGLGLAISQRIVDAHQGTIRVAENGTQGASIEIILPRTQG